MSAGIARRQLGVNNTMFILRLPDFGVLKLPIHPDSLVETGDIDYFIVNQTSVRSRIVFDQKEVM